MPTISVIVPVYKVEKYIRRCVDSILGQTFTDLELILVDDGSPDNCGAICDEYAEKDSRVIVIHQKNGGVSKARNAALDIAKGMYVAFCDSDDWWNADLLERTVGEMHDYALDWVSFGYRRIADSGMERKVCFTSEEYTFCCWESKLDYVSRDFLTYRSGWETWTRVFRYSVIENNHIRFCETCGNMAEDLGFCVKFLLCAQRIKAIDECLYNYFFREESMMAQSQRLVKFDEMNEVSLDVAMFAKPRLPQKEYENYIGVIHYMVMKNQYNQLFRSQEYRMFPAEIKKIKNQKWYRCATRYTICNRKKLTSLFGKRYAVQIVNFSCFCLHRLWYPYRLVRRITKMLFGREQHNENTCP